MFFAGITVIQVGFRLKAYCWNDNVAGVNLTLTLQTVN